MHFCIRKLWRALIHRVCLLPNNLVLFESLELSLVTVVAHFDYKLGSYFVDLTSKPFQQGKLPSMVGLI